MTSDTGGRPWDELDRRLLHALDLDGRASFSRIAAALGVSDRTIARRYRRLTAEGGLRVVAVRDVERLGLETWLLRLRCAPDAADTIARALARRPDTAWIALTSGGTEVTCVFRFRTRGEHEDMLLGRLPRTPSIIEIRAHQLLWRFYGGPRSWLNKRLPPDVHAPLAPARPTTYPPEPLGPEDEPLIAALEKDGRATLSELQRATGRSESVVRRRLDRLLSSGTLYIDVQYDQAILGDATRALLWITAAPQALDEVGRALATHPEVTFASATAGPSNLLALITCQDTAAMYHYLSARLGTHPGIQHIETTPVLRRVKELAYDGR